MSVHFPAPNTLPHLLLTLAAISGEFPASLVSRLPGNSSYLESVVTQLKKDQLIRTFYRDGLRGLRVTAAAKKTLLAERPDQFRLYLTGSPHTNALKSEVPRRLRLHRMAEVLVTMYNAEVGLFADEKPPVFSPSPPAGLRIEWPAYYSSREVKEMGADAIKIRNSRSTGMLLTPNDIYMVYNVGPSQIKWEKNSELRLKAMLHMALCQRRMPGQYQSNHIHGLVFGQGMEPMLPLMASPMGHGQDFSLFVSDFPHFHYLTNDHRGETVLQLLCHADKKAALDDILSDGLSPGNRGLPFENDRLDEYGDPVLFGHTCDIPRIQRFNSILSLRGRKGTLICFDFQEEALCSVCGPNIEIQSLDFDQVKALLG